MTARAIARGTPLRLIGPVRSIGRDVFGRRYTLEVIAAVEAELLANAD
jgi:hypothetical protein